MFEGIQVQVADSLQDQGKKTFHVGAAQSIQTVVSFCQPERTTAPEVFVERYSIRMTRENQTIISRACTGNQIEFSRAVGNRLLVSMKAQVPQPFLQQIDNPYIGLIPFLADTAD